MNGRGGVAVAAFMTWWAMTAPLAAEDRALSIMADRCGACHGVTLDDRCVAGDCGERVRAIRPNPWDLVIPWMEALGCRLSAEDKAGLTGYLMARYGKTYPVRWERLDPVPEGWNVVSLKPFRNALYAGIEGAGSVVRLEGSAWRAALTTDFYTMYGLTEFRGRLFAGTNQPSAEIWSSADGVHWARAGRLPSEEHGVIALGRFRDALYAGTSRGRIYRSVDGATWTAAGTLVPSGENSFHNWVRFLVDFDGTLYAGVEGAGMFRSRDGRTWETVALRPGAPSGVRAAGLFGGALYVGTTAAGEVWRTSAGDRWTRVFASAAGDARGYVASFAVSGGALYAGIDGLVFRSPDGRRWEEVGHLTPFTIEAMAEFDDALYTGTALPSRAWVYRMTSTDSPKGGGAP
ncbi:MAG: hypothetical protein HY207_08125 [Nitrospirae bacterium]|nr:hypothetical protein [Nitrospirota bacterium]